MMYVTLFKWLMMQIPINQWAASDPGFFWGARRGNALRTSFPSIFDVPICLAGSCWWLHDSTTHTASHTLSVCILIHTELREELTSQCCWRKAWIFLLVLMFAIIVNPPGTVYCCPLTSLSRTSSHPSVSYVILPQINAGHDCSPFIGLCGVHSSQTLLHQLLVLKSWLTSASFSLLHYLDFVTFKDVWWL